MEARCLLNRPLRSSPYRGGTTCAKWVVRRFVQFDAQFYNPHNRLISIYYLSFFSKVCAGLRSSGRCAVWCAGCAQVRNFCAGSDLRNLALQALVAPKRKMTGGAGTMVFGWLNRKFEQSHRYEADRFLTSLRGGDVGVIDMVLGNAMFWSEFYRRSGHDLYEMESWIMRDMLFPVALGKNIKAQQNQNAPATATGLMVWLFSSRALLYPELRLSGREIWQELSRATPDTEEFAFNACVAMGWSSPDIDFARVPSGLERLER